MPAKLVFCVGLRIENMDRRALEHELGQSRIAAPGLEWYALQLILQSGDQPKFACERKKPRSLGRANVSDVRLAKPDRRFDQRFEHRLQIEGRAADDLEHVGGGGLLLQRFAQLVEQAGVLDGDDGLGGEVRAPARSACR